MNKSKVSYLVLSDIHLGHSRIKTEYIIANLRMFFETNHTKLKSTDIIFLAGDVYDKLLTTSSNEFIIANEWLSLLAMYCRKYTIKLRILEGTPSHDWHQVSVFTKTLQTLGIDLDYKYIDTLSIEYMEDLGINILYLPDEWNHTASDTYNEIKALLTQRGIASVDIGILHGQFHFQLPMIELPSSHNEEDYLGIVKYYINIGHIHTSRVSGRILGQGSFDRLAHNEEEDKGGMVMNIYHTGDMDFVFLKNKNAYPHKKYDLSKLSTEDIVGYLTKTLSKLKLGTRVKIIVPTNEVNKLLVPLKDKFKDIIFTIEKKKIDKPVIRDNKVAIEPFEITKDNIKDLLIKEVLTHNLSKDDINIILSELNDVV